MSSCTHTWSEKFYRSCPYCEGDKNRRRVEELREAIIEFKQSKGVDASLVARMRALGHPDVDGLVAWKERS